jgi:hypothetical protein
MEYPILKIKRDINSSSIPSGLTSGELFVNLVTNTLYVGNDSGTSKAICGEVIEQINTNSNSNFKIPTQKAVKSYIDSIETTNVTGIEKRKSVTNQTNAHNINVRVLFSNIDGLDGLLDLTYNGGTFTNILLDPIVLNVNYGINTLTPRPAQGNTTASRYSWIQTSNGKIYGSTVERTYLNTDNPNGTTSSTMVSSAIFKLEPNEQFAVFHKYVNQNNVAPISIGGTFDVHNNSITVFRIS